MRRDSSFTIQRIWRGYFSRKEFAVTVLSAIKIQRISRGFLARNEIKRQQYAALTIQQYWWGFIIHKDKELAATLIQSKWRAIWGKRRYDERSKRRDASITMQKIWRGYHQSIVYAFSVESIVLLQKVGRGYLARKELPIRRCRNAAIAIQRIWRGFSEQVQYQLDLLDIISIQSLARKKVAAKERLRRCQSVAVLQGAIRCALARRVLWKRLDELELERQSQSAATTCQVSLLRFYYIGAFFGCGLTFIGSSTACHSMLDCEG